QGELKPNRGIFGTLRGRFSEVDQCLVVGTMMSADKCDLEWHQPIAFAEHGFVETITVSVLFGVEHEFAANEPAVAGLTGLSHRGPNAKVDTAENTPGRRRPPA